MSHQELLPHLFRTEYRKIVSVLCKHFGLVHIEIAEDLTSETFLTASELWGLKGLPENPTAWLYTVAKNKAKNYLRNDAIFRKHLSTGMNSDRNDIDAKEFKIDLSAKNIQDSQLQMLFVICHPSIPDDAQVGLALRILCGFGIDEIARAFLTTKENINKRLFRAKEKLRAGNIMIEIPHAKELTDRLDTVLRTLYLIFNEGYYSSCQDITLNKDLCLEAMRLTHLLLENESTNKPAVHAFFSLMCFHASRFQARVNDVGEPVLYKDQDDSLWDHDLISRGEYHLNLAYTGNSLSRYHLEAGIAYWHTNKSDLGEKWENILQLYNQLLILEYSPIAALNRTYALSKANGPAEAIVEAEKLHLDQNHLYHALLGELYSTINKVKARTHFEKAFELAISSADKNIMKKKMDDLA
ncbi:MAG: sigma-70 family RNA polymerase sigma factor [Chryseolinea sp.]